MPHLGLGRRRSARSLFVLATLLCACSAAPPIKVGWEYAPDASFTGLRSYAWVPGPQERTGDPRVDDIGTDRRARQAIDTQLAAQGFVATSPESADFLVGYHVRLVDRIQSSTTRSYYGVNRSWANEAGYDRGWFQVGAPATYSQRYDVGTLTVFIENPATQRPIWQGIARAVIKPSDDIETRKERLAKAAALILEKFPPAAPSPRPSALP